MSKALVDIDPTTVVFQQGKPPTRGVRRRADASELLKLIDSMKDGEWFATFDTPCRRLLRSRLQVWRIQHGLRAFGYSAVDKTFVVVKGDGQASQIPTKDYAVLPTIHTGEPPLRTKSVPGLPRRVMCPFVTTAMMLQPGEWFIVPKERSDKAQQAISRHRNRNKLMLEVTCRKTDSGDLCVYRVPTTGKVVTGEKN